MIIEWFCEGGRGSAHVKRRFLFVAEWVNERRQMAFFLLCMSERSRGERERGSRDKSLSEWMCAVPSWFPRTEVWGGLIFLAAVRSGGEKQRQRGAAVFYEVPWLPHTRPFDPDRLPCPPPPPHVYVCMSVCQPICMSEGGTHESMGGGGVIGVVSRHKWWQTTEQTLKVKQ